MDYSESVSKRLKQTELEILKKFDELCKKYGIKYFVYYGTAIGAIRHNGFIPWDDDIDVAMIRDEYLKFLNIPNEEYSDQYLSLPAIRYLH